MNISSDDVIDIVAEVLNIPVADVSSTSQSEDFLEWDALGQMRVCMAIEERHGVHIEPEKIDELNSIDRLVTYLRRKR